MFHRAILKASLGRMSKKQQQHQNQQQQQNLLLRESQNRRGRGSKDSSIARASLEVSLDNADTVIDGASLLHEVALANAVPRHH